MNRKIAALIIVIGGAAAALLAGPRGPLGGGWRPITMSPEPAGLQLGGLVAEGVAEAIGFGVALAVLALGRPVFTRLTASPARATTAQVAAAWLLGSWWPHSALHMHFGLKAGALVVIEPVFHAGSILAAAILLWALVSGSQPRLAKNSRRSSTTRSESVV